MIAAIEIAELVLAEVTVACSFSTLSALHHSPLGLVSAFCILMEVAPYHLFNILPSSHSVLHRKLKDH